MRWFVLLLADDPISWTFDYLNSLSASLTDSFAKSVLAGGQAILMYAANEANSLLDGLGGVLPSFASSVDWSFWTPYAGIALGFGVVGTVVASFVLLWVNWKIFHIITHAIIRLF